MMILRAIVATLAITLLTAPRAAEAQKVAGSTPHAHAQRLLFSGQVTAAEQFWEAGLQGDPSNWEMAAALGAVYYADQKYAPAATYLQRAASLRKDDWTLRLLLGTALYRAGDQAAAEAEFRAVIAGAANKGTVQIASDKLAGRFFSDQSEVEARMPKQGKTEDPFWLGQLMTIGWAPTRADLHDDGSVSEIIAAAVIAKSFQIGSGGDYVDLIGPVRIRAISYARNHFLFTVQGWKGTPQAGNFHALSFQLGFFEFLLVHIKTRSVGQTVLQAKLQALIAQMSGKYADAEQYLKVALREAPDDPQAHSQLGTAYSNQQQLTAASKEFDEALLKWPDYHHAHFGKGAVLLAQRRPVEALVSLTKAIEVRPATWEAYLNAASASGSLGRLSEAAALLAEAEELAAGRDIPESLRKWRSPTSPEQPRK